MLKEYSRIKKQFIDENLLLFRPADVLYIIVRDESEIPEVIKSIDIIMSKYSDAEKSILKTRILESERIGDDF